MCYSRWNCPYHLAGMKALTLGKRGEGWNIWALGDKWSQQLCFMWIQFQGLDVAHTAANAFLHPSRETQTAVLWPLAIWRFAALKEACSWRPVVPSERGTLEPRTARARWSITMNMTHSFGFVTKCPCYFYHAGRWWFSYFTSGFVFCPWHQRSKRWIILSDDAGFTASQCLLTERIEINY